MVDEHENQPADDRAPAGEQAAAAADDASESARARRRYKPRGGKKHAKPRDPSLPPVTTRSRRESFRLRNRPTPLQETRAPEYLVIGHICADLLPDGRAVLGGTALYSALTAASLGLRVGVLTRGRYGTEVGGIVVPGLDEYADRLNIIVQDADTPTVFVNEYRGGLRTQKVDRWAGEIDLRALPSHWVNSRIIHLGPIAREIDIDQTEGLVPAFLGVTPQGWMREWPMATGGRVKHVPLRLPPSLLIRTNAVIVSVEEIAQARQVVEWVGQRELAVITQGEQGAWLIDHGKRSELPGFPLPSVDPTGAGDVFAAAFFARAMMPGFDATDAARFANATAALSLGGVGVSAVPTRGQVETLLATNADLDSVRR